MSVTIMQTTESFGVSGLSGEIYQPRGGFTYSTNQVKNKIIYFISVKIWFFVKQAFEP